MRTSHGDIGDSRCRSRYGYRRRSFDLRTVSDLAVIVSSPAFQFSRSHDGASPVNSRTDFRHPARQARNGIRDGNGDSRRRIADLAVEIIPPALHSASGSEDAGMVSSRRYHRHSAGKAVYVDWLYRRSSNGRIAQLSIRVRAPALDSSCARERASVGTSERYRRYAGSEVRIIQRDAASGIDAVSKLAYVVEPPAFQNSRVHERARMRASR